jgi:hypothetical protein
MRRPLSGRRIDIGVQGFRPDVKAVWHRSDSAIHHCRLAGAISGATTWNNQPGWIRTLATPTVAYGYNGNCPANWIGADARQAVQDSVSTGNSVVTFGLKADNESDGFAWKKFNPNATLIVNYDSPPDVPGGLSEGFPGQAGIDTCQNNQAYIQYIDTTTPSLHATVTDADNGPLVAARFEWYVSGNFNMVGTTTSPFQGSGSPFSVDIPAGTFTDGTDIAWRVAGVNDSGTFGPYSQWCEIKVDTTPPANPPAVGSTLYTEAKPGDPNAAANGGPGETGTFTFGANGIADVAGFKYCEAAGQCTPVSYVAAAQVGGSASVPVSPVAAGPNELCVQSVDRAGNPGPVYRSDASSGKPVECYHFLVGAGSGIDPRQLRIPLMPSFTVRAAGRGGRARIPARRAGIPGHPPARTSAQRP